MKYLTAILLTLVAITASAQSVTISKQFEPGFTQHIKHVAINYKNASFHYFGASNHNVGVSYKPIQFSVFKAGLMATKDGMPTPMDMKINFILDVGFDVQSVRISWTHISNGFALWHKPNSGYDAISFTVKL